MNRETQRLLRAVFGAEWEQAVVEWWTFDAEGKADMRTRGAGRAGKVSPPAGVAVYYSVGLTAAGAGRGNKAVSKVMVLVFDDVGTKVDKDMVDLLMPVPDYVVESSPGNFQYGWAIRGGATVEEFKALTAGAKARFGVKEANAASNLVRAPMGVNGKGVNRGFAVRLVSLVEEGGGGHGAEALLACVGAPAVAAASTKKGPQQAGTEDVRRIFDALDNSVDGAFSYDDWINAGMAAKGTGAEGAREIWIEWSYRAPIAGGKRRFLPEDKWETFFPDSAGMGSLERLAKDRGVWTEVGKAVFDAPSEEELFGEPEEEPEPFAITPFVLKPVSSKKPRPWIYGHRLVRGYVSATIAAGGVGKSSLTMVEALAMATGKDLLGVGSGRMPREPVRVWLWNGEDPFSEMELRLMAACQHYGISNDDIGGRLFVDSGREKEIKIAAPGGKNGKAEVNEKLVRRLIATAKARRVDVLMIDPLVAAHFVSENDNMQMDVVMKTIGRIAGECFCAVEVVHHTRKASQGFAGETSVDDARGASAVINAVRHARVLSPMTKAMGEKHGITNYRSHFCMSRDAVKTNLTPPLDSDAWFHMVSVDLGNGEPFPVDGLGPIAGDLVGVVEKWSLTVANVDRQDMVEKAQAAWAGGKVWRYSERAGSEWAGLPVAEALGLDIATGGKPAITAAKQALERWIIDGWFRKVDGVRDNRHRTVFVEVSRKPVGWDEAEKAASLGDE